MGELPVLLKCFQQVGVSVDVTTPLVNAELLEILDIYVHRRKVLKFLSNVVWRQVIFENWNKKSISIEYENLFSKSLPKTKFKANMADVFAQISKLSKCVYLLNFTLSNKIED